MRAYLPGYELKAPRHLNEALEWMARAPGAWKPFAGGTDVMVLLELGNLPHRRYLSLWHLKELRGVSENETHLTLGALTTYTAVRRHPVLAREFPMLDQAAGETGGIATQNRGTLGGNIANASPAADSPPALLCYDAELELLSAKGARWVRYHGFHRGYKVMDLRPEEIIGRIRLSRAMRGWRQYYRKVGTRRAQAIAKVCLAAAARFEGGVIADVRIALGSVAPTVLRCERTEHLLRGAGVLWASGRPASTELARAAQHELAAEMAPIDDMRSTAAYRRRVAQNLLADFLAGLTPSVSEQV